MLVSSLTVAFLWSWSRDEWIVLVSLAVWTPDVRVALFGPAAGKRDGQLLMATSELSHMMLFVIG